jgi:hypothetical protein
LGSEGTVGESGGSQGSRAAATAPDHAADPLLGNSNYGIVFPFWDMAFGTHADPLRVAVGDAGNHDDPIPRQFMAEIKSPITYGELVAHRQQAT